MTPYERWLAFPLGMMTMAVVLMAMMVVPVALR